MGDVVVYLYNPLDEEQTSNYFFAAFDSFEQEQAENFAMCVNDMVAIEDGIDISAGLSIPGVLLSLGKAPTLASIIVALAQAGLDSVSPSDISDLYSAKDNAIKYYERLKG